MYQEKSSTSYGKLVQMLCPRKKIYCGEKLLQKAHVNTIKIKPNLSSMLSRIAPLSIRYGMQISVGLIAQKYPRDPSKIWWN